jgi:integrase
MSQKRQHLTKRNGYWRFIRRVPDAYRDLDERSIVQQSTHIRVLDDPRGIRATEIAAGMNRALEDHWRALKHGGTRRAVADYEAAIAAARRLGIAPPIEDSAQRTIEQLLDRIERLMAAKQVDPAAIAAVYDTVKRPAVTFSEAAESYIESRRAEWDERHALNWERSIAQHVIPVIGESPVAELTSSAGTDLILKVLEPIWRTKTKTASEVRGRIESILDYAKVRGFRDGENPARWRGHLDKLLPRPSKVSTVKHFDAMPYAEVPAFMRKLRASKYPAAPALEFAILTATRSEETLGARKSEINRQERIWTIPAERMKGGKEHRIPLSEAAIAIVNRAKGEFLFPGLKPNTHLARNVMRRMLERLDVDVTVHGFRSSFRDWAAELTDYPNDIVEMALAHIAGSKVEKAYKRTDLLAKRQALMADWSRFCGGGK